MMLMRYHRLHSAVRPGALAALMTLTLAVSHMRAQADDGIFPSAPAAKPFIDFDGRGFLINGKRTFITSGSLHYSRVPRAQWRDRLLRFKRAGINTVQTYAFWNFHEPQEGKWDFSGDKDLDAFLKTAKALDMYAVVRVGPYVCAEWDSGGYPVWLRFKPGVKVREDNPAFEGYVDRWFEHVMPIVSSNQINRGGSVIMVQLENEHPRGWGRDMPNNYFRHLRDKALALGLQVPHFFSGLHHGSDPGGDNPWDSKGRDNPWYSTEFWPGWYNLYGPLDAGKLRHFDRGTWKIIANGGNGYNYYMLYGGTNFGYTNNDEDASSYDYGAAVGQTGDLRPIYYRFKRAAWFARSFASVLEDSENATNDYKGAATGSGLRLRARKSSAGTIVFLDNNGDDAVKTQIKGEGGALYPAAGSFTVDAGEIMPVVLNYQLTPEVKLNLCAARVLGIANQGNITTLVIYGAAGDPAELHFNTGTQTVTVAKGAPVLVRDAAGNIVLKANFPTAGVEEYAFAAGPRTIRVLAVSSAWADRTWFVEGDGNTYVVSGPDYVADAELRGGRLQLVTEQPLTSNRPSAVMVDLPMQAVVYGPAPSFQTLSNAAEKLSRTKYPVTFSVPTLGPWQVRRGDDEAQSRFKDTNWKVSEQPLQMGADGDFSAYAWYRTTVRAPAAGAYNLNFSDAGDWIGTFINGQSAASSAVKRRGNKPVAVNLKVNLTAGDNTLAVLAAHYGRDKLFGHLGAIEQVDAKGLNGPVRLTRGMAATAADGVAVTKWRWKATANGAADAGQMAAPDLNTSGNGWQDAAIGQDVFNHARGAAWFRTVLDNVPGPQRRLAFQSVDDKATVYLNGKQLLMHEGWDESFEVPLDAAWRDGGPNVVAVLVDNNDGVGGLGGPVTLQSTAGDVAGTDAIKGWKMRGGIGDPPESRGWQPWPPAPNAAVKIPTAKVPTFYRTTFTGAPPAATGPHPIWRVTLAGMSRGFVWLNGHNLGRYPEKVPVNGLYLPEPWLENGRNALVIFDEEGNAPAQVHLAVETAASRNVSTLAGAR